MSNTKKLMEYTDSWLKLQDRIKIMDNKVKELKKIEADKCTKIIKYMDKHDINNISLDNNIKIKKSTLNIRNPLTKIQLSEGLTEYFGNNKNTQAIVDFLYNKRSVYKKEKLLKK
jgi:hypothetical protein